MVIHCHVSSHIDMHVHVWRYMTMYGHMWSSTMTMESVLLSIRQNMVEGGARIASRGDQAYSTEDYSEAEAKDAFDRMMRQHGW